MAGVKKVKAVKLPVRSEHDEQCALFKMIEWHIAKYPELRYAFAIPNGGHRHIKVATKMKAEGVKPGVPDIFIPILGRTAINIYTHTGLFIEMKKRGNKPMPNQIEYIEYLRSAGYQCNVCYTAEEAMKVILEYLG